MRRRAAMILSAALLSGAAAVTEAQAAERTAETPRFLQRNTDTIKIDTTWLADNLHLIQGAGGNVVALVGPNGALLVDDEYPELAERVGDLVHTLGKVPVRFVVNTHWHVDHTGGNEVFGQSGVLIIGHENVRRRLEKGQRIEALGLDVPPAPSAALPLITYEQGLRLHLNGETVEIIPLAPAHTDGDSAVHFRTSNVLHTGDLYFSGTYPFYDLSSGGTIDGMIAGTERLLDLANAQTVIIPGHGPLSNRMELQAFHDMLVAVRARVQRAIAEGRSRAALAAEKPLSDLDPIWGDGFLTGAQFLDIVYADLTRRQAGTRNTAPEQGGP